MDAIATALADVWGFLNDHLLARAAGAGGPFWHFVVKSGLSLARDYLWFLVGGLLIFGFFVRKRGERFSLWAGIKYRLPLEVYRTGVDASATAAAGLLVIGVIYHFLQAFERSHVVFSFGKTLDKVFYSPHFHRIHHSALLQHRDKNLGSTGGLCLWDRLAGTL